MLTVNEIFHSIQGESTRAGCRCVFVRLTGCNLRCSWCDTPYAFYEGRKLTVEQVVQQVEQYGCGMVEITGGEPLLQPDVYPLMEALLASGKTVLIETGGHIGIERIPSGVIRIVDVKCPGSGEADRMHWPNLDAVGERDEVKFVIRDRTDYEYAKDVIGRYALDRRCGAVLLSPVHAVMDPKELAEWMIADRLAARLQLQVHKYIWEPETRGV
ncbi:MAG TPA: radical SAM protein [Vicinamibacterales bacterium]|nr:radical SAM protein [Vicinamibacterales bacterium]